MRPLLQLLTTKTGVVETFLGKANEFKFSPMCDAIWDLNLEAEYEHLNRTTATKHAFMPVDMAHLLPLCLHGFPLTGKYYRHRPRSLHLLLRMPFLSHEVRVNAQHVGTSTVLAPAHTALPTAPEQR